VESRIGAIPPGQDRQLPVEVRGAEIEPGKTSKRQPGSTDFNNLAEDKGLASHGGMMAYPPNNLS